MVKDFENSRVYLHINSPTMTREFLRKLNDLLDELDNEKKSFVLITQSDCKGFSYGINFNIFKEYCFDDIRSYL